MCRCESVRVIDFNAVWMVYFVLLLLVHVPLIVFLHYGLYVDLSVPLT